MSVPHPTDAHNQPPTAAPETAPPPPGGPGAPDTPDPEAAPCSRCGVIDRPTLSAGTGPHAIRASCQHCGKFLRWVSVLAPSERLAHRMKARLEAMQKHHRLQHSSPIWWLSTMTNPYQPLWLRHPPALMRS